MWLNFFIKFDFWYTRWQHLRILEFDHSKNTTRPHINARPCKYCHIYMQTWLRVHVRDDSDTINTGRTSHQECEGRRHRAMLTVTIFPAQILQPLSCPPILLVSFGGLVVKHSALAANGRRFEPRKRSKLFQGLISRLTTSWVADHVKWRCRLHWII